ncbi:hypothetical protein K469DRAFT_685126 [Zopfia rhizophila CBS 207.26]|uniref:Uncharacterized protein n=1 Tax=Zopfia rhizophila CBS 207.26 TaxID=1314779 RepID=A0A6A6ED03_9PEZI|nr:hypothetical protein K469DRAFT_685126 [Zopfia rhizophila CBS 207.26]
MVPSSDPEPDLSTSHPTMPGSFPADEEDTDSDPSSDADSEHSQLNTEAHEDNYEDDYEDKSAEVESACREGLNASYPESDLAACRLQEDVIPVAIGECKGTGNGGSSVIGTSKDNGTRNGIEVTSFAVTVRLRPDQDFL